MKAWLRISNIKNLVPEIDAGMSQIRKLREKQESVFYILHFFELLLRQ